ncbi:class I SAM-dependent methyltransferase [Marinomonas sp. M1K-6]|uniref:Ribosomal RNA small subunit methyltransferase J n=1 Tax=Marinomonas profundi TaxID=2726122 RepID=A0A847RAK1_9GAMM|nr:class I SAM-dependent methyltransferase [Marinomonas profundi]NLQ18227.1 class I SAM-dependent methyltransferase [Marinomonas profundi]UDV03579.1 class I SAM-dependent methyltransferase [Marinomonas profundi]
MLSSIAVATTDNSLESESRLLAQSLNLPFISLNGPIKFVSGYDYLLLKTFDGVAIAKTGKGAPKPVYVDFTSGTVDHRRRFGGGKGQDIAKAVGLNKGSNLSVLDATAGLGRDAFVLACLGCSVALCERVGFVRAMLQDGLYRASLHHEVADIVANMHLLDTDITQITDDSVFDVVYLDPMYPHTDKASAAAKKEMAFFRDLVGKDTDADALLSYAMQLATYRVVVKRPKGAVFLNGTEPTYQLEGKSGRFDVYVLKSLDHLSS